MVLGYFFSFFILSNTIFLEARGAAVSKQYSKNTGKLNVDFRFIFMPGDRVLLRQKDPGKLKVKAVGPYLFVKYKGRQRTRAVILNNKNKERIVSVTNLLQVYAETLRLYRFDTRQASTNASEEYRIGSESSIASSDGDHKLPPGVVLLPGYGPSTEYNN